ncbi:hypothetical protein [Legionella hackeliae]|uniref:hypothetical protein n=1 Tax=Legionella hackeliae TaxID=449 RepID=UPI0011C04D80|nr:hypothetical protein [Legionella hackeliae]
MALYKNLLNAFYYLQQGLVEFEKKADQKELDSTFSRVLFLKHLGMKVGAPIYQTVIAINALKGNPHLTEVLEQGLNLTEPLKKFHFLRLILMQQKGLKNLPLSALKVA